MTYNLHSCLVERFVGLRNKIFILIIIVLIFLGERDFFLAANAPKNTFLNTLFESKNSNPPKFIDKENFFEEFNNMKNIFIFGSKNFLKMILNYLSNFMDENYYQNEKVKKLKNEIFN